MKSLRKTLPIILLILVVVSIFFVFGRKRSASEPLETSMVLLYDVEKTIPVNATLSSRDDVTISTELPTRIAWVGVTRNEHVQAGQELLRLDRDAINAQIRHAQLAVERAALAEQQARLPSRHMSKKEILRLKKATEQARETVRQLIAQAKKTSIISPIDGVVVDHNVHVGEVAQGVLMRIVDPTSLRLEAYIPEVDIAHVHEGDRVRIVFDAYLDREVDGTVTSIDTGSTPLQNIVYYRAEVAMDTADDMDLRDGMSAEIDIITQKKQHVLSLPRDFVAKDAMGYFVLIPDSRAKDGVKKQYFEPGLLGDKRIEILSGLKEHKYVARSHSEGQN